ncbi:MAG: hypothetical protein AAGA95_16930, partial [Pseudomonadota bacterium]
ADPKYPIKGSVRRQLEILQKSNDDDLSLDMHGVLREVEERDMYREILFELMARMQDCLDIDPEIAVNLFAITPYDELHLFAREDDSDAYSEIERQKQAALAGRNATSLVSGTRRGTDRIARRRSA